MRPKNWPTWKISSLDNFEIRMEFTLQIVTDGKSIVPSACFSSIAEIDYTVYRQPPRTLSGKSLTSDMRIAEVFDDRFICMHEEIAHRNTEYNEPKKLFEAKLSRVANMRDTMKG